MKNKKHINWLLLFILIIYPLNGMAQKIDKQYHLIGHRGGVTENRKHPENSIAALDEAVERGYSGVEIDIQESKDGVLFLYHYRTLERDYDTTEQCANLTWNQIQRLRPLRKDGSAPISVEEYCKYAKGKIKEIMCDIKLDHPSKAFYNKLENILRDTGFLENSYFIGHGEHFLGKGKITMLIRERDEFFKKYGEKTKDYYFLFAGIDEINSRLIEWCNNHHIQIMACVNRPWRETMSEKHIDKAQKDLDWLKSWGIKYFQIDSDFDKSFRN